MTPEMLAELAAPFPPEAVGTKPEIWCPSCKARDVTCVEHEVKPCEVCGENVTEAHDDVDYVGHAWVRERLNKVDPNWDWKPYANDHDGLPMFDKSGGLWLYLIVGGKAMIGYGDAPYQRGGRAVKESIGDGFRNAGQSFGIALDMWQQKRPKRALALVPAEDKGDDRKRAKRLREEITKHGRRKGIRFATTLNDFQLWTERNWADGRTTLADAPADALAGYLAHVQARSA